MAEVIGPDGVRGALARLLADTHRGTPATWDAILSGGDHAQLEPATAPQDPIHPNRSTAMKVTTQAWDITHGQARIATLARHVKGHYALVLLPESARESIIGLEELGWGKRFAIPADTDDEALEKAAALAKALVDHLDTVRQSCEAMQAAVRTAQDGQAALPLGEAL